MAVTTYWWQHYADIPRPDIYFVNPTGLKSSATEINGLIAPTEEALKLVLAIMDVRTEQKILKEFPQTYPTLMKHKQCPTLVFDVCMYSGRTMKPILHMLGRLGFADVRTGVANNQRNTSGMEPDIVAHPGIPYHPCYVFGR